jgi:BMFP domain-containing protein YqiC
MGVSLSFLILVLRFAGLDTIARKGGHDKAIRTLGGISGLEQRRADCHCLGVRSIRRERGDEMTQTSNRFFDEIGRLMNDAAGAAQGVKREVDTVMRNQAERILRDLDIVKREEFEALKDMARLAREENEALKARLVALEAKMGISPLAPETGSMKTDG